MALPQYKPDQRLKVSKQLDIDEQYLYQILKGIKQASPALARQLNKLDPKISLKELRPNDWRDIWPELKVNSSKKTKLFN
jgi:hypothetical protein